MPKIRNNSFFAEIIVLRFSPVSYCDPQKKKRRKKGGRHKDFLQNFKITALWMLANSIKKFPVCCLPARLLIAWVLFDFVSNSDRPRPRKTGGPTTWVVNNKFCISWEKKEPNPFSGKPEKKAKFLTWKFPCFLQLKIGRFFWQNVRPSVVSKYVLLMTINLLPLHHHHTQLATSFHWTYVNSNTFKSWIASLESGDDNNNNKLIIICNIKLQSFLLEFFFHKKIKRKEKRKMNFEKIQ